MDSISTLILAGGKGKRMGVLCQSRPKPALPFGGKYRVIDFSLSNCLNSGISKLAVLTGYQKSYLNSYLQRWESANLEGSSMSLLEPKSGFYAGTADAVYQNLKYIEDRSSEITLILAADHIYKMDYRKMVEFHKRAQADMTVGVVTVPIEEAYQFGIVSMDENNRITNFVEKPRHPESDLVSMGIYVFNSQILMERLNQDAEDNRSAHDFGHNILPKMVSADKVCAYGFKDKWQDIGTPEAFYQAQLDLTESRNSLVTDSQWPIRTVEKRRREPVSMTASRHPDSIVSEQCVIKGRVQKSILSSGVWVGERSLVKDSVIMGNVSIGKNSLVSNCIVDEGVAIGDNCEIGSGRYYEDGEVTIIKQGMIIPSHSIIRNGGEVLDLEDIGQQLRAGYWTPRKASPIPA